MTMYLIQNNATLQKLLPLLQQADTLGVDTEFDNNRIRYGMTLCVMQIATKDACFIIDVLAFDKTNLTEALAPIWALMADEQKIKIVFSGAEDLQLIAEHCQPKAFFDLAVAARLLGMGYPSLGGLLKDLLGLELDKDLQVTDWYKRPLTPKMLDYLVQDTAHLIRLKDLLSEKLHKVDRWAWMQEEMSFAVQDLQAVPAAEKLQKLAENKFKWKHLSDFEAFLTLELLALRDRYAQRYDLPVHFVFSNDRLVQFCQELPDLLAAKDWSNVKGIHRMLKTEDHAAFKQELKVIYQQAQAYAKDKNTHVQAPITHFDKRAFMSFTQAFVPIQAQLGQDYDEALQQMLLSGNQLKKVFQAGSWEGLRQYARKVIWQAAKKRNIDPQALLQKWTKVKEI